MKVVRGLGFRVQGPFKSPKVQNLCSAPVLASSEWVVLRSPECADREKYDGANGANGVSDVRVM